MLSIRVNKLIFMFINNTFSHYTIIIINTLNKYFYDK